MRTFNESEKSKKTVASMIIKRPSDNKENKKKGMVLKSNILLVFIIGAHMR